MQSLRGPNSSGDKGDVQIVLAGGFAELWGRLLKLLDDHVLRPLALIMAETLACGISTAEAVAMTTSATLNNWRPDDAFFDLLGGKDVLQAMLADIASTLVPMATRLKPPRYRKASS